MGGVFDTKIAIPPEAEPLPDFADEPIVDVDGYMNEVIVIPDYSNGDFIRQAVPSVSKGTTMRPEDVLIDAVNRGDETALAVLGGAKSARYAILSDRLADAERQRLGDNDPLERLHRYLVLRYPTIEAARNAELLLKKAPGIVNAAHSRASRFSFIPNDPYFQEKSDSRLYQWGMHAMNMPSAWDKTKGHGYVGIVDSVSSTTAHADLASVRGQLSFVDTAYFYPQHGLHVTGIVAGSQNNGIGVTGSCPNCSVALAQSALSPQSQASSIRGLVDRGVSVINMSWGLDGDSCANKAIVCEAIAYADQRDVLLVGAAGNYLQGAPQFPAAHTSVLSVGGAESLGGTAWQRWYFGYHDVEGKNVGSNAAGATGVVAPARSIVSTMPVWGSWNAQAPYKCADTVAVDESGVAGDGYASCTGTSQAAPHITALAGLLRSTHPRLSRDTVEDIIRASGSFSGYPSAEYGYGMPNANTAVNLITNYNPKRLTPLFAFYSSGREDYFYSTSPQMASAARAGTLRPSHATAVQYETRGTQITSYANFPGMPWGWIDYTPRAEVWLFTTPINPIIPSIPLVPLYRLSWKCGDSSSTVCANNPYHTDFAYTTDASGIASFQNVGYKLDGIEGYLYPRTMTQPSGTVRFLQKYNAIRDDHAIFPESELVNMTDDGYTMNSGPDWLGYAYPNLTGAMPSY